MKKRCLRCLVKEDGFTIEDADRFIESLEALMDDEAEDNAQLMVTYNKVKKLKAELLGIPVEQV